MSMDIGALMRIRNAAQEALGATPADQGSAWRGLVETYGLLREQAASGIDEGHRGEFERLFPETIDKRTADRGVTQNPEVLFVQQDVASEARTRLAALAGWLNGFIEEAQFRVRVQADADAYARERVKAERGVGFTRGDRSS